MKWAEREGHVSKALTSDKEQMLLRAENIYPINGAGTKTYTISQKQSTFNVYFCYAYMASQH